MKRTLSILLVSLITVGAIAQKYVPVDEGSRVHFTIKNLGINTGGSFQGLTGSIVFDPANLGGSSFQVSLDAKTVNTDIELRDEHLRGEEYLDVAAYPVITFQSMQVTRSNSARYLYMFGTITIRGVTKEVKFPFKATAQGDGYLFEGQFKLNRRDFGVGGSSLTLSDELNVSLSVFARKAN
ncbi:MAG TPA: YceI family protein [Chitinophagaceae bacterium]|nr:YceI family protein [Chitinophagaceae bacterium]